MKVLLENRRSFCGNRVKGGEDVMSMSKRVGVAVIGTIFLVALVSAVPVEAKTPIRWDYVADYIGYYSYPDWYGELVGENAEIGIFITDVVFLSNGQKLDAIWWIEFDDGEYLEGTMKGFFVYTTHDNLYDGGQYVLNGEVTDTSPDWSDWNGRNVHVMGFVTPWPWVTNGVFQIN